METALENLSKEDLLKVISSRDQKIEYLTQERDHLKSQVEMLRRMQFGQKRERFEGDPNQLQYSYYSSQNREAAKSKRPSN